LGRVQEAGARAALGLARVENLSVLRVDEITSIAFAYQGKIL